MAIDLEVVNRVQGLLSDAGDGGTAELRLKLGKVTSLKDGTGAGKAEAAYIDELTIAASGNTTIDLAGSLTDRFGNALVFENVKAVLIVASSDNTNTVVVGNGTNPFAGPMSAGTTTITLPAGGVMSWVNPSAAGWAITGGSNDELKIANGGAGSSVTVTVIVVGEIA